VRLLFLLIPLSLAGCLSSGPDNFPRTEATTAEIVSSIRGRNASVRSLSAVVAMVYEGPDREGTFDAVVLFQAPRKLRLQAFKDLVVDSKDLFDLILSPEGYAFRHEFEDDTVEDKGALEAFPEAHGRFSGIYWAGKALFVPGAAASDAPVEVTGHLATGVRVETRLESGLRAEWDLDPKTLRPLRGVVHAPNRLIHLEYLDYEGRGGPADVPEEVRFRDGPTQIQVRLADLELDAELEADVFRLP
jgi:hypothetical protein